MSHLQAGLSAPINIAEFNALDISTRILVAAGVYDQSWPEARRAFVAAVAEEQVWQHFFDLASGIQFLMN